MIRFIISICFLLSSVTATAVEPAKFYRTMDQANQAGIDPLPSEPSSQLKPPVVIDEPASLDAESEGGRSINWTLVVIGLGVIGLAFIYRKK